MWLGHGGRSCTAGRMGVELVDSYYVDTCRHRYMIKCSYELRRELDAQHDVFTVHSEGISINLMENNFTCTSGVNFTVGKVCIKCLHCRHFVHMS